MVLTRSLLFFLFYMLVPIHGYKDCHNFPFFLVSKSPLLASHAKLVSGYDLDLFVGPPKRSLSTFVDLDLAAGCLVEAAKSKKREEVTMAAYMVGPNGYAKFRAETCYFTAVR